MLTKPWSELTREEAEQLVRDAESVLRAEYYNDVRDLATDIKGELTAKLKDGEEGESLREWLYEHIHQTLDGHQRVIYTWQAQKVVLFSDNDSAYFDDFGAEGAYDAGGINWSRLAFCAMEKDLFEQLEAEHIDVNDPSSDETKEACGIEAAASDDEE